jgi:hypothetical protein
MTATKPGRRTLRTSADEAKAGTRKPKAERGTKDGEVAKSAVAALGTAVEGARSQGDELDRLRRRGQRPDSAGGGGTVLESVAPSPTPPGDVEKANTENSDKAGKPVRR